VYDTICIKVKLLITQRIADQASLRMTNRVLLNLTLS